MSLGLVCFLIKKAGNTTPPTTLQQNPGGTTLTPNPPVYKPNEQLPNSNLSMGRTMQAPQPYAALPKQTQQFMGGVQKFNPALHDKFFTQGQYAQGENGNYNFTPNKQFLDQVHSDPELQNALMKQNDGDKGALWNHMAGKEGVQYNQAQYANYKASLLSKRLGGLGFKDADVNDPAIQSRLAGYQKLETDVNDNIINPATTSAKGSLGNAWRGVRTWLGTHADTTSNPNNALADMQSSIDLMKANGAAPDAVTKAQSTLERFKGLHQAYQASGYTDFNKYKADLTAFGGDATQLQQATTTPEGLKALAANADKDADFAKWQTDQKGPAIPNVNINSDAISDQIPWQSKLQHFASTNPWLTGGAAVGGTALLAYLVSKLFSGGGGQQQQPVVNNYYQGPQRPMQQQYNRNNLMG